MKEKAFKIELSDEAESVLDNSNKYYFDESPKVADTFFQRINISLENIKNLLIHFLQCIKP